MTTQEFREGREQAELTQMEAALKLGVSQPYLSLLEQGQRRVPPKLARKAAKLYGLSPTTLPFTVNIVLRQVPNVTSQKLAEDLASLGYPGFSYMRPKAKRNPAEVLLSALGQHDLEPRVTAALPWLVLKHSDLNWKWLVNSAKQNDLQNRLGYVVTVAVRMAESAKGEASKVPALSKHLDVLEHARLANEDTLCHESLSNAERVWLREKRPEDARHWNLLTDLTSEQVRYATA